MTRPTPEQAFAALRAAGLMHNDPDLVELFDLSKPDYVARAKAAKPSLFAPVHVSRTATTAEVQAGLAAMAQDQFRARRDAASARTLADLQRRYGKGA